MKRKWWNNAEKTMRDDIIYYYYLFYYYSYYWIFVVVVVVVVVVWVVVCTNFKRFLTDASRTTRRYRTEILKHTRTNTEVHTICCIIIYQTMPRTRPARHRWWTSNGHRVFKTQMVFLRSKSKPGEHRLIRSRLLLHICPQLWQISRTNHRHSK